jgi:hypothetical protein
MRDLAFAFTAAALIGALALLVVILLALAMPLAHAHDDGRFAGAPLRDWFNGLKSAQGLCCSFADGIRIEDPDVDITSKGIRVRLCGTFQQFREAWPLCIDKTWIVVPENAIVHEPNRFGPAVVWPEKGAENKTRIRCFIPGSGV